MNEPSITAVIPTFRRPKLLRRAIESVLAQSFKNLKVCVYDNASGDETEDVVAEYIQRDNRVFYVKNTKNIGALENMSKGVKAVTTDFFSLLNDDDILLPDFYSNAIKAFREYPEAGFVCAKTITVDLSIKQMQFRNMDWQHGFYQPSIEIVSKINKSHFTSTGVLFRRSLPQLIGPFEQSGDDMLHITMAAAVSPFVVLDYYGAVYTVHPGAFSRMMGLRQGEIESDYKALLSTVDSIMKTDIPVDRKVHLLLLGLGAYGESFDLRQLNQRVTRKGKEDESAIVPFISRVTWHGLIIKVYEVMPKIFHPVLTRCVNLARYLKRIRGPKQVKGGWLALPEDACSFFFNGDSDVSRLQSSLQQGNRQGSRKPNRACHK